MEADGPSYAPVFKRLERELAAVDNADDPMARARQLLRMTGNGMRSSRHPGGPMEF